MVYHTAGPRLSSQLDIIIYDAIRSGPIISLETCEVFPLEAVYGYVEVKATISSSSDEAEELADNSIEQCLGINYSLRGMIDRRYHFPRGNSPINTDLVRWKVPSIRSYVFAFDASGAVAKDLDRLAQRMATYSMKLGKPTHLHGLFIAGRGFLFTRAVDEATASPDDLFHVSYTANHPLVAFKISLTHALARFPRPESSWAPAIEQYFPNELEWKTLKPNS